MNVTAKIKGAGSMTENYQKDILMRELTDLLHRLGVPAHLKGFYYLREAILMCEAENGLMEGITKWIYPEIARRHKTTAARVERAMRHAITVAWERGDIDIIEQWFGYCIDNRRGKPTNSEFVTLVADRLRIGKIAV